jgi:hypothetical protein
MDGFLLEDYDVMVGSDDNLFCDMQEYGSRRTFFFLLSRALSAQTATF